MNHPVRRKDRAITEEEARGVLERGEYGVLATCGHDGQPYGVPLSYVVMNGAVYIHCAQSGRKLDNIAANPAVSFTVVGPTKPVYDSGFSTYYESAVIFGKAREITDEKEKRESLMRLAEKYLPEDMDKAEAAITRSFSRTAVYAIAIETVTGKAKRKKQ